MRDRPSVFSGEPIGKLVDLGDGVPPTSKWLVAAGQQPWHLGRGAQVSPSGRLPGPSQLPHNIIHKRTSDTK